MQIRDLISKQECGTLQAMRRQQTPRKRQGLKGHLRSMGVRVIRLGGVEALTGANFTPSEMTALSRAIRSGAYTLTSGVMEVT